MEGIVLLAVLFGTIAFMTLRRAFLEMRGWPVLYVIKKGRHYSYNDDAWIKSPWNFAFSPRSIQFRARFGEGTDQPTTFLNKLYGVCYGFDPHFNSIRIGWRYRADKNRIELFSYTYEKGKWAYAFICRVKRNDWFECHIDPNFIRIITDEGTPFVYDHKIKIPDTGIFNFRLDPYFGGRKTSGKDCSIFIDILNRWD